MWQCSSGDSFFFSFPFFCLFSLLFSLSPKPVILFLKFLSSQTRQNKTQTVILSKACYFVFDLRIVTQNLKFKRFKMQTNTNRPNGFCAVKVLDKRESFKTYLQRENTKMGLSLSLSALAVLSLSVNCFDLCLFGDCR